MSQQYLNKAAAATAAATASLERAKANLFQVEERLQTLHEEHHAGLLTLTDLLKAEGLIAPPRTLKSGPCSLAVFFLGKELDVLSDEMEDLFVAVSRAELAVRAAEAVLRQV